jgi:hypothetical protein
VQPGARLNIAQVANSPFLGRGVATLRTIADNMNVSGRGAAVSTCGMAQSMLSRLAARHLVFNPAMVL